MLEVERQLAIVTEIKRSGSGLVSELAKRFGVSQNTIRRDLAKLEKKGIVKRIHGGAILNRDSYDIDFGEREVSNAEAKEELGKIASSLVASGDTVFIDAGTTCHIVAKYLKGQDNLTVITNSVVVATEMTGRSDIMVILCGGIINERTLSLVGPPAESFFEHMRGKKLFLAAGAVCLNTGFVQNPNVFEIPVKKAMMRCVDEVYLVVDKSKFQSNSLMPITHLSNITGIVTNADLPEEVADRIRSFGCRLITRIQGTEQ